jgi:Region found in RelA / SpoT proteins
MEILWYWRACHEEPPNPHSRTAQPKRPEIRPTCGDCEAPETNTVYREQTTPVYRNEVEVNAGHRGCRAILANDKRVRKLVRELKQKKDFRVRDYISGPKEDGYRSIHLVGDFSNGRGGVTPIELQIRTAAQHSWATAVEISDLFTGQAIKSNRGSDEWRQFFHTASDQLALIEDISLYNQISQSRLERFPFGLASIAAVLEETQSVGGDDVLTALRGGEAPKQDEVLAEITARVPLLTVYNT